MTAEELVRYSRHFCLKELGQAGQEKLKQASVLVVGAGGLGSPLALYLAAAGIGKLGIIDGDKVEDSNLQRQILYITEEVGSAKSTAAVLRLKALNPYIEIIDHNVRLDTHNALDLIRDYDLIADCVDNFSTRYLVNDAAGLTAKPLVSASVLGFEGQLTVFHYQNGPCYRCLYPEPPPNHIAPSCSQNGVLGALPGVLGSLQAIEVLKIILNIGEVLNGQLLYFDALQFNFQKLAIHRDPSCALCGQNATIHKLQNFCVQKTQNVSELSCAEVQEKLRNKERFQLLDIREPNERKAFAIEPSVHIPLRDLEQQICQLNRAIPLIVYCHSGIRSAQAAHLLGKKGFTAQSMSGGLVAWLQKYQNSGT